MFLEEVTSVSSSIDFSGPHNGAMFWAHVDHSSGVFPYETNKCLCDMFSKASVYGAYTMDSVRDFEKIPRLFERYAGDYPPEITDMGWDIFSRDFADQMKGDKAYIAVNDAKPDDYFMRAELPVIRERLKRVTTLEPAIDEKGRPSIRKTSWAFDEWESAQQRQWQNHGHYLDGSPYPKCVLLPR